MKTSECFVLIFAIFSADMLAQTQASTITHQPFEIQISSGVAEKLLVHKVDPDVCPHIAMPARIKATVVVAIEIGKSGNVLYSKVISGPAMLRKPILDAVRKYQYKPYLLNGKAVEVETTVSVTVDNYRDCHMNN